MRGLLPRLCLLKGRVQPNHQTATKAIKEFILETLKDGSVAVDDLFSQCAIPHSHLDGIAAAVEGTGKERMFNYKISKAIADWEREFGRDEESERRNESLVLAWRIAELELVRSKTKVLNAVRRNDVSPLRSLHCALLRYLVQLDQISSSAVTAECGRPTSTMIDEAQSAHSTVPKKNRK
jgi:hypothetical protein